MTITTLQSNANEAFNPHTMAPQTLENIIFPRNKQNHMRKKASSETNTSNSVQISLKFSRPNHTINSTIKKNISTLKNFIVLQDPSHFAISPTSILHDCLEKQYARKQWHWRLRWLIFTVRGTLCSRTMQRRSKLISASNNPPLQPLLLLLEHDLIRLWMESFLSSIS